MSRSTLFIGARISLAQWDAKIFNFAMQMKPDISAQPTQLTVKEEPISPMLDWFRLAAHPATARRAFITALIVGVVLIAINHGAAIISGQVTRTRVFQMCLTVLVPYIVSTVSSVSTRRELRASQRITPPLPPQ